jgi:hypothetical protein
MMKIRILKYGILLVMASCVRQGREASIHEKIYRVNKYRDKIDTVYGEFAIQQLASNTYLNSYWFHAAGNDQPNNFFMMPDTTILHYFFSLNGCNRMLGNTGDGLVYNQETSRTCTIDGKSYIVINFFSGYVRILWTEEFGIISYLDGNMVKYSMVHFENPEKEKIVNHLIQGLLKDTAFFFYGDRLPPGVKYPSVP